MIGKEIVFRDPVVERVVDKFVHRSDVGFKKYGRTLDTERKGKHKDLAGYLNDIQEELMYSTASISSSCTSFKYLVKPFILSLRSSSNDDPYFS